MSTGANVAPASGGRAASLPPLTPLQGTKLAVGTIALSLATFMNVLDTSIANVSIPAIAGDTGVSPDEGTWVITSFAVSSAISVPLTGWLAQRFGQVRIFLVATLAFTLASFLCGLAPNLQVLIAFRILQGAVAGPMIPMSQALLLSSYPPERAGSAMAMWAMTTLVAPIVGPPLGGWISDNLSWPWIFFINIPVGLISAALTASIFRNRESITRKRPIDFVGLILLVLWVGSMQMMLDKGRELDWFASPMITALCAIAIVSFVIFLIWELTEIHPIVDLSLFGIRNFAVGTIGLALAYGLFFGNVILIPLWLQQYMNYTATQAGLSIAPVGLLALALSPWVGRNVNRFDPRMLASISFIVFAYVMWMRSEFSTNADWDTIVLPAVIQGIAVSCMFIPMTTILLSGLPPERIPAATGLSNFFRMSAAAFGTSITTTMWDDRARLHHARLVESITNFNTPTNMAIGQLHAAGFTKTQSLGILNRMIDVQSYTLSADELFYGAAAAFLMLVGVVWLAKPARIVSGSKVTVLDGH